MITNDQGTAVSKITLDEWGNLNQVEYGNLNEVNYTGKKYEPATGLYYFNQRYYDPRIGRFLTEDPAGQSFNPYLYAGNNPMMYTDPDGEWFWLAAMAVGAIAGGWGKDLSKTDTWRDIAFGAAVGAAAGAGLQWAGGQLGLTVNLGFKYEGFGEITLASTDTGAATVFSGVVGVVGSAMSSMFPERKNYSSYDDYMADSMGDAYYPGIPVLASTGKYPVMSGQAGGNGDYSDGGITYRSGRPVSEVGLEMGWENDWLVPGVKLGMASRRVFMDTIDVLGSRGTRQFAVSLKDGSQLFRLDKEKGLYHYHRWPDLTKHRPWQGGL